MKNTRHNTFFISDLHFGHNAVIRYSNRPFKSLEEMEAKFIKRWNARVNSEDRVVVAGDFLLGCPKPRLREILAQLNGTKILVRGNHDLSSAEMITAGFAFSCDFMQLKIANELVNISHYPYKMSKLKRIFFKAMNKIIPSRFYKPRNFVFQKEDDGGFLIHGHTHSKQVVRGRQIHVGVDAWNYEPVPIGKIADIITKIKLGRYQEPDQYRKLSFWDKVRMWRN
jgi:calcineurin-like phosphoesterase family protein